MMLVFKYLKIGKKEDKGEIIILSTENWAGSMHITFLQCWHNPVVD